MFATSKTFSVFESHSKLVKYSGPWDGADPTYNPKSFDELGLRVKKINFLPTKRFRFPKSGHLLPHVVRQQHPGGDVLYDVSVAAWRLARAGGRL